MPITNEQLREAFLGPQMECYFRRKIPDVAPGELRVRIEETLKFLNMAAYCHGSIPVSQEIDDIWHYWILETREYGRLCSSLQSGTFIHHSSNLYAECAPGAGEVPANTLEEDVAMLADYVLNYGPFEEDRVRYWRLASHLVQSCGMEVDELNAWLTSTAASPADARS